MQTSAKISRRDVILIGTGLAVLVAGKFADSQINGFAPASAAELQAATEQLQRIPDTIGSWTSEEGTLTAEEIKAAGINGYIRREYKDHTTGYRVNLTLLCGLSGPMSVHPPTACFEGVGYSLCSGPVVVSASTSTSHSKAEFNKSAFRQGDSAFPEVVRVFWAWGHNGPWQAPQNPRLEFRGQPFLYKLYLTDRTTDDAEARTLPQIETFLDVALPVIEESLYGELK